jgi:EKC/KEOPS complex subunit CGI121/TPRKB
MSTTKQFSDLITVRAFKDVKNASLIKSICKEDARFGLVDLHWVGSEFHLRTATVKSLLNEHLSKMKTKSLSNEILYQLSPTTNINGSADQFGIKKETTIFAFIFVDSDILSHQSIIEQIDGTEFNIGLLNTIEFLDEEKMARIVKYFKLTPQELEMCPLDDALASRLATKDFL